MAGRVSSRSRRRCRGDFAGCEDGSLSNGKNCQKKRGDHRLENHRVESIVTKTSESCHFRRITKWSAGCPRPATTTHRPKLALGYTPRSTHAAKNSDFAAIGNLRPYPNALAVILIPEPPAAAYIRCAPPSESPAAPTAGSKLFTRAILLRRRRLLPHNLPGWRQAHRKRKRIRILLTLAPIPPTAASESCSQESLCGGNSRKRSADTPAFSEHGNHRQPSDHVAIQSAITDRQSLLLPVESTSAPQFVRHRHQPAFHERAIEYSLPSHPAPCR